MGAGNYAMEFTGLCIVHVTPDVVTGKGSPRASSNRATAYVLRADEHCARLVFPLLAVAGKPEWPKDPPDVLDLPGQPIHLSLDVAGVRITVEELPTIGVVANPCPAPGRPPLQPREWRDVGYALDLAYLSGEPVLAEKALVCNASALVALPAGRLEGVMPTHPSMSEGSWTVSSPTEGKNGKAPRTQALTDRIRLVFDGPASRIRLVFRRISNNRELGSLELKPTTIALSGLCAYREAVGMPDVVEYNRVLVDKKVKAPVPVRILDTANGTRCPPTLFIQHRPTQAIQIARMKPARRTARPPRRVRGGRHGS